MNNKLTLDDLNEAAKIGGPSSLRVRIELEPAGGEGAVVAPARYTSGRSATYVYETRYFDGENSARRTVLIDSRTSFANRMESVVTQAIRSGEGVLGTMPHMVVRYDLGNGLMGEYFDTELPHRAFDGHLRVGFRDGAPASKDQQYVDARNSTLGNLLPLFELSPETVMFGGWDSTRSANQLRIPSVCTGEVVGVLADQSDEDSAIHRSGARIDPVGARVEVADKKDREAIVDASIDLSENTGKKFLEDKSGKGSTIGLGSVPPNAGRDALDGIAVSRVVSMRVLSFATLRSFHFGKGKEGDEAIRVLIAAVLLRAMAGYDENPVIRANCFLAEKAAPEVTLDKRFGIKETLAPLTVEDMEELLRQAYAQAHERAGIVWAGQEFVVDGNMAVLRNSGAEDAEAE